MTDAQPAIRTTDGTIALVNLQAQIDGQAWHAALGRLSVRGRTELVELISLRGQMLGQIADYERAGELAEQLAREAPGDGLAFFARARTRATFHRFTDALADLDEAERLGMDCAELAAERATALQALGRYAEALTLHRAAADRRGDFESLGALAGFYAERGETVAAERAFAESRTRFRGVSPFPLALLDFQRGRMWLGQGNLQRAHVWLDGARHRLPVYAPAQGHLAEVECALRKREAAIARLRPLALASDNPDYAAQLARILGEVGRTAESARWRALAAARYDELVARHPEAFADHAADFWLTVGADSRRALELARQNLAVRETPRACALLSQATLACEVAQSPHPCRNRNSDARHGYPASRQPRKSVPNQATGVHDVAAS